MKQRIITALILAPLVILGIFKLSLSAFMLALAVVTLLGIWEWAQFVNAKSRMLAMFPAAIALFLTYCFVPSSVFGLNNLAPIHLGILILAAIWWVIASLLAVTYPKSASGWQGSKLLRHGFGMLTLIPFFWSVVMLRAQGMMLDPYHGSKLVMFVCFIVWAADSGAYFSGKSFGKHKMAPAVSPNKTIEGLVGGIICALIVGWIFKSVFDIQFSSPLHMIVITLVTVVISVLGDLVESMFKRVSGVKDSSNLIPGHGGILDRIDSLTAAFPVFALLYFLF